MFQEVKDRLMISGDDYDAMIIGEIKACALDLTRTADIVLPGVIDITRTYNQQTGTWTISDSSTLTDEYIIRAIATWCSMMIGNPPNAEFLRATYRTLKGNLQLSSNYTNYGGDADADADGV